MRYPWDPRGLGGHIFGQEGQLGRLKIASSAMETSEDAPNAWAQAKHPTGRQHSLIKHPTHYFQIFAGVPQYLEYPRAIV